MDENWHHARDSTHSARGAAPPTSHKTGRMALMETSPAAHGTAAHNPATIVENLEGALATLDQWDDAHLVGQLFSLAIGRHSTVGIAADEKDSNNSAAHTIIALIESRHLGGVCYFPVNLAGDTPAEIAALTQAAQAAAQVPLLISTDQENGTVSRLKQGFTRLPSAMALAATRSPRNWRDAGRISAKELASVGILHAFAPNADMNTEPTNPVIGVRSPGADIAAVQAQLTEVLKGMAEGGVASTLKHFPGHGTTVVDSHLGLPHLTMSKAEWATQERAAFEAGLAAGADSVMIGHLVFDDVDPENPATFSRKVVTGELREGLGFDGVIVTDALEMGGASHPEGTGAGCVAALAAGVDQLLMPGEPEAAIDYVIAALQRGELDRGELIASARRILTLKLKLARMSAAAPAEPLSSLASPANVARARQIADESLTWRDPSVTWTTGSVDAGARIFIIGHAVDAIGRGVDVAGIVGEALGERGFGVTRRVFGDENAVTAAAGSDAIIVVTRDAWREPEQKANLTDLLALAADEGAQACVIASRNPSDSGVVGAEIPMLLMFSDLEPATRSVIEVLSGGAEVTGSLPVDLVDEAGAVRWPARLGPLKN